MRGRAETLGGLHEAESAGFTNRNISAGLAAESEIVGEGAGWAGVDALAGELIEELAILAQALGANQFEIRLDALGAAGGRGARLAPEGRARETRDALVIGVEVRVAFLDAVSSLKQQVGFGALEALRG